MTYSGWEIFEKLNSNPATTTRLDAAQVASHKLKVIHEDITRSMESSQTALASFWKGKAAESGAAGLAPLIQTSKIASENMDRARQSMFDQNAAFHHTRGAVVPVEKERAGDWGPGDILSIGASDDEKAAAKFDADTKKNVEAYEPYWQSTQPRQSTLAPTYPAAHDPNVDAVPITADPINTGGTHTSGFTGGSGAHRGSSGGYTGGPSTYTAPPGAGNYVAPPVSKLPVSRPPVNRPPVSRPPVGPPGMRRPTDGTDPSWARTPSRMQPPGGFGPGGFGPGGDSSGGGGGGFGPGGGGGFGPGGGFGTGGGAGGSGSGAPGSGSATGAGRGGMSAAEGAMGRGGVGGPAAGKPASGMGGMGGGKGGKGGEDEEHQRKILLPEEDPDSIFGGYDGDKPTPPVIGA
ncbi:hypothetical protein [Amycolatopsis sp. H20-H5]|uniref:hypothetical protein n=1 Tax=Amycolatopsis sp. H20-H5 TaxID=3046309 RepID=UPI002DC0536A|nr:hypothetical protein [Amycolatopsis sp. H20-H5]MEC3980655.1 hypothetical protein [Amycolatopsis sp. H20-H5]